MMGKKKKHSKKQGKKLWSSFEEELFKAIEEDTQRRIAEAVEADEDESPDVPFLADSEEADGKTDEAKPEDAPDASDNAPQPDKDDEVKAALERFNALEDERALREMRMRQGMGDKFYEKWKNDRSSPWGRTVAKIPYGSYITPTRTLAEASRLFDSSIVGREREKEEMLRKFATFIVTGRMRRPILLVGEPGCGKSHFAQRLAGALGFPVKYINMPSLNSPIALAGTERHYSNSRIGELVQTVIDEGTLSVVFVFDEVDKTSPKGDDGSIEAVLLGLFDPLWNGSFTDRSLEVPVDLSHCIFLCTANEIANISEPLLDRMDVIRFDSYTEEQALRIIEKMSIPGIIKSCGMTGRIKFAPEVAGTVVDIIENGSMRDYEKLIEKLVDNAIFKMLKAGRKRYTVTLADIDEIMPSERRKAVGFCG